MKHALFIFGLILPLLAVSAEKKSIGIIQPIEHQALTEIVTGFSEVFEATDSQPVDIKVKNSQNDPNLERAIIQQMRDGNEAIIAPIGIDATQMAIAMVHNKPIISLASDITEQERQKLATCNVAVVHDEIPVQQQLAFFHQVYPDIHNIALIHSSANKVFPEVKAAIDAGKQYGINIDARMINALPDLYQVTNTLPERTQAIFILKDHLIVSGISVLVKAASERHIPLMTSDQGSIQAGAMFALGVREREIGVEGAKLAEKILQGTNPCDLPIVTMKNLTVFVNEKALQVAGLDKKAIMHAATTFHYGTEEVTL